MGLRDDSAGSLKTNDQGADNQVDVRRIDQVVAWLSGSDNIARLREQHELPVYRFGEGVQIEHLHTFAKSDSGDKRQTEIEAPGNATGVSSSWRWLAYVAMLIFIVSFAGSLFWLWSRNTLTGSDEAEFRNRATLLARSTLGMLCGILLLTLIDLTYSDSNLVHVMGLRKFIANESLQSSSQTSDPEREASAQVDSEVDSKIQVDWLTELSPRGTATQVGDALQTIVNQERGGSIAGVILITDGRNNAGLNPARATAAASAAAISVYPIGIGSREVRKNVAVADVQAPPRVFPGDTFRVKAMIKAEGLVSTSVQVQLVSVDEKAEEAETLEDETIINLGEAGQGVPVEFKVSQLEQGKRRYIVRTVTIPDDQDPRDNEKAVLVEIIDRKTQVLLLAGGPTREFRFLRNQLYRDTDINLHVWLQSATEGADQEAHVLLTEFPQTRDELYQFDCIVAFDPDWRDLSGQQANWLERWVAEQAGGLIVVAGPVNTPEWTRRPRGDEAIDKIRRLYPVSFYNQGSAQLKLGRFGGDKPFPIQFSREGRAAEFLWLGDSAVDSQTSWQRFAGVFGYYAVNEPKSGANILANFSDQSTSINDRLPIYLANHSYGGGRVFFQASGEMWRARSLEVEYFRQYYTKLIRWASQGRLLRDSNRGILTTDRQRCWMGDQITVQAMLRDRQDEPLLVPDIESVVQLPNGSSQTLVLRPAENTIRPGIYSGRFSTTEEGDYQISLPIPDSVDLEILTASVQAAIPDLEKEKPQRNDRLLSEIASKTNGQYFIGLDKFSMYDSNSPRDESRSLIIAPQDQVTYLTGTIDLNFKRKLMTWLFVIVVYSLTMTWAIRRLHKLA